MAVVAPSNQNYIHPMQTALHISALVRQLRDEIIGGTIVSAEFYRKQRAAYFFIKADKTRMALGFLFHPAGAGTFLVPASKVKLATAEKPWPVFDLQDASITGVEQAGLDRIFFIDLEKDSKKLRLAIEAIGPNGNIWLLDNESRRAATLRKRTYDPKQTYQVNPPPGRLSPTILTDDLLLQVLQDADDASLMTLLSKKIIGINKTMAVEILRRADLDFARSGEVDQSGVSRLRSSIEEIVGLFSSSNSGYLYEISGGIEVYPFKLSQVENAPEKFKRLSLAVMAMTERRQTKIEEAGEEKSIVQAVRRSIKRHETKLQKVAADISTATDYENYKRLAELIQINLHLIQKGQTEALFSDIYTDPPGEIKVSLNPALSASDNAEAYFKKYRKGRLGLELLTRREEIVRGELDSLKKIAVDLEQNFEEARRRYSAEIASLMPGQSNRLEAQPRLPYREFTLSTGLTVYVGRDGSDNDRTTFEFARPYELWFHTQQCAGSHVVIKFPNKSFQPSKREIEEAASLAALHSKAKHDGLVPVIYTERKYVRKPRKAKPGLVTVEREKSVMVPPGKPDDI